MALVSNTSSFAPAGGSSAGLSAADVRTQYFNDGNLVYVKTFDMNGVVSAEITDNIFNDKTKDVVLRLSNITTNTSTTSYAFRMQYVVNGSLNTSGVYSYTIGDVSNGYSTNAGNNSSILLMYNASSLFNSSSPGFSGEVIITNQYAAIQPSFVHMHTQTTFYGSRTSGSNAQMWHGSGTISLDAQTINGVYFFNDQGTQFYNTKVDLFYREKV